MSNCWTGAPQWFRPTPRQWVGKISPEEQAQAYATDELAALSKLPADVVEQLSIFGLIGARDGRYGFRDLSAARQAAQLLGSGIGLSVITKGLTLAVRGPARFGAHSRSLYSRRPSTPMRCMR
jgi:hypothetical protein